MNKSLKLLALFLVSSVFAVFANAETINKEDFLYSIDITVPGYTGTTVLHNFPVLVKLSEAKIVGFNYDHIAEGGSDIRFADSNGNIIPYEIETWDPSGTSYIWVRLSTLSGTDTSFSMFYGSSDNPSIPANNPEDVWIQYAAVFHGGEKIVDATGNSAVVVTNSVSSFYDTENTVVSGAMTKPKSSIGIQFSNPVKSGALSSSGQVSFSGWFNRGGSGTVIVAGNKNEWSTDGFLALVEKGTYFSLGLNGKHHGASGKGALTGGTWQHLAFSYDETTLNSYFNGENIYSNDSAVQMRDANQDYWAVGSYSAKNNDAYTGDFDEIRFYNGAASADWIKAEYDSVNSADTFVSLGDVFFSDYVVKNVNTSVNGNTLTVSYVVEKIKETTDVVSISVVYGKNEASLMEKDVGTSSGGEYSTSISNLIPGEYIVYVKMTLPNGKEFLFGGNITTVTKAISPSSSFKSFDVGFNFDGAAANNVPVLIRLSEEAISGFSYSDVIDKQFEMVDVNGNLLPYEIDTWNEEGESLIWVKVTTFENNATITVRYGTAFNNEILDSEYVWKDYVGVWHLNETNNASTYGSYPNSTAVAGIDGEKAAVSLAGEEGMIGQSVRIVDAEPTTEAQTKGGVFIPDSGVNSPIDLGSEFAISAWLKHGSQAMYYDHVFYKRLKANNSESPNNAFAIEISRNGGTNPTIDARGSQSGSSGSFDLPTSLQNWSYVTFVYADDELYVYQDGALVKTLSIIPVINNNAPIAIGNNVAGIGDAVGDCAWNGWVDELRLMPGVPDATYLAAEYAAMAGEGALTYSSVAEVDASLPAIVGYPTCVWTGTEFLFTGTVEPGEGDVFAVYRDLATGVEFTNKLATITSDMASPIVLEETPVLPEGATYSYGIISINADGTSTKRVNTPENIYSGEITIEKLSDASEITITPGVFRISRDPSSTVGELTIDVVLSGEAIELGAAENIITSVTIPDGASYVDIEIAPIPTDAVQEDKALTLTLTGNTISYAGEISAEMNVFNVSGDYRVRYVNPEGSDENDGLTEETPFKTLGYAVDTLCRYNQDGSISTIYLSEGLHCVSPQIEITNAFHIIGMSESPADVVVSNTVRRGWNNQNQRVFYVNNKDAFITGVTMQAGGVNNQKHGGNLFIGTNGGVVSNCVIEAGSTELNSYAAGARVEGGLLTHTILRNNSCGAGSGSWQGSFRGGALEICNSGIVENCLLEENNQTQNVSLVHLYGSSIMRNCTILNSSLSSTNEYCSVFTALRIDSKATAQNIVIAGVTNTIDGAVCLPTGTVANFINGAVDADITGLGFNENTVVGTPEEFFSNYATGNYRPRTGGKLAGAGLNYEGMPQYDLSGEQLRLIGANVDIGCYEGFAAGTILFVR